MAKKIYHLIVGTARRPLMYRTTCGKDIPRERGVYAYTIQERQERVTCPECRGEVSA